MEGVLCKTTNSLPKVMLSTKSHIELEDNAIAGKFYQNLVTMLAVSFFRKLLRCFRPIHAQKLANLIFSASSVHSLQILQPCSVTYV